MEKLVKRKLNQDSEKQKQEKVKVKKSAQKKQLIQKKNDDFV
jgi:hypothetical protein